MTSIFQEKELFTYLKKKENIRVLKKVLKETRLPSGPVLEVRISLSLFQKKKKPKPVFPKEANSLPHVHLMT